MTEMDPDKPLSDEEWSKLGAPMHGVNGLPLNAQKAVRRAVRGRPPSDNPRQKVTIRLEKDLLTELRKTPGWQTRLNEAVRVWVNNDMDINSQVNIDQDILEQFMGNGEGWMVDINNALRDWVDNHHNN